MIEPSAEDAELALTVFDRQKTKAKSALISGIQYDGMPKGSPKGNTAVNVMADRVSAETYCEKIKTAIKLIAEDNENYGKCLYGLYIKHKTSVALAMEMCVSRATVYNIKKRALSEFANIIPDEVVREANNIATNPLSIKN